MTGAAPVPNRPALWAALSHMQIPCPGAGRRFEQALADRQGWTLAFAERVTDEYRRFLYLAATAGFEATPSRTVDEAWHLHLDCPHYRDILCGQILGRPLEHRPSTGGAGEAERHHRQYEDTVALYARSFLRPPPTDIWPRPAIWSERRAAAGRRRGRKIATGLSAAFGLASLAAHLLGYPVVALVLFAAAIIPALLSTALFPAPARSIRDGGSCGSGGCGVSAGDHGCGSSCGGSGCGGD